MHNTIKRTSVVISMLAMASMTTFAQNAEKVKALSENDPHGFIMSITAACVVFLVLLVLYIIYKQVGNGFNGGFTKKTSKTTAKGMTPEVALAIAMAIDKEVSGEVQAAIAMALHQHLENMVHDEESFAITIRQTPSAWNSKQFTLRQLPIKK